MRTRGLSLAITSAKSVTLKKNKNIHNEKNPRRLLLKFLMRRRVISFSRNPNILSLHRLSAWGGLVMGSAIYQTSLVSKSIRGSTT